MNRRDLAKFLDSPQAIREYEASLANYTFTDLDEGYDNPDPDAPLAGTTTPTVPTPVPLSAELGIALTCDRQTNLTNFDRYEWQVSDDAGVTAYALGFSGTGLGVLDADTDVAVEFLVHRPLPLDVTGGAGVPVAKTWHYRVRRVTKLEVASAWSSWVSGQSLPVGSGSLAEDSVYATQIIAAELQAMFARISYALTIGFGGTGSEGAPDDGDRRTYIDEDDFKQQIANAAGNWEDRVAFGRRAGTNIFDGFLSGTLRVGRLISAAAISWKTEADPFGALATTVNAIETSADLGFIVAGGTYAAGSGANDRIAFSDDGGETWSLVPNLEGSGGGSPWTNIDIEGFLFCGNDTLLTFGEDGWLSKVSSFDGSTAGTFISQAFDTANDDINGMAYNPEDDIIVAVGDATTYVLTSEDDGATWQTVQTNPAGSMKSVFWAGGDVFIGVTASGQTCQRSTDNGDTWAAVSTGGTGTVSGGGDFGDGVFICCSVDGTPDSEILRSVDAGVTWTTVKTITGEDVVRVRYAEGFWFAGNYRSADGGLTWLTEDNGQELFSFPPTLSTAYAIGYDSLFKNYIMGGDSSINGDLFTSYPQQAGAGIVEQGSNANGEYVIFSNGLQICWQTTTASLNATTSNSNQFGSTAGTMYFSDNAMTFPKAYGTAPVVIPNNSAGHPIAVAYSITTTGFTYRPWYNSSVSDVVGTYIAIGWA